MVPPETDISKKLQESGYNRDGQQCRAKIKNLEEEYNIIMGYITENGRKSFKFYKKLDEILRHQPASAPSFLVNTGSLSHSMTTVTAQSQESDAEEERTDGKQQTKYFIA